MEYIFLYSLPTGIYLPVPTTNKLLTGAFDQKCAPKLQNNPCLQSKHNPLKEVNQRE